MTRRFSSSVYLWTLFLISSLLSHGSVGRDPSMFVKHRVQANDAVIQTFEIDGDVIDCVDVNKQPAFEHPLLINHTLQMKPIHYPKQMRASSDDLMEEASHPLNLSRRCPEGSIPVRRNGHLRNGSSVTHQYQGEIEYGKFDLSIPREHSLLQVRGGLYHGAKASINVWNPSVQDPREFSASIIRVASADGKTSLEAGWTVNPLLYGDHNTRFFSSWTTDGYRNGCYNLRCPGFVQTSSEIALDAILQPVSVNGGKQYTVTVDIYQDRRETQNWWLRLQGVELGYWPKALLPSFEDGANVVSLGGEVANLSPGGRHTSTQMGSGEFSSEPFGKASFFKNVQILEVSYVYIPPLEPKVLLDRPECYGLRTGDKTDTPWGYFFFYGGKCA